MKKSSRLKHLFSYAVVGGIATLVEWGCYYLFDPVIGLNTYAAVALSYVFSTFANWLAGRLLTFRTAEKKNLLLEIGAIYLVSIIGLGLNEIIMAVCMKLFSGGTVTDTEKLISKIIATVLVFAWNYLIRDRVIYRKKQERHENG